MFRQHIIWAQSEKIMVKTLNEILVWIHQNIEIIICNNLPDGIFVVHNKPFWNAASNPTTIIDAFCHLQLL